MFKAFADSPASFFSDFVKVTRSAQAWTQEGCPSLLGLMCPVAVRWLHSSNDYRLLDNRLMQSVSRSEISTFSKLRYVLYTSGWKRCFDTCTVVILWYWCCKGWPATILGSLLDVFFFSRIRTLFRRNILMGVESFAETVVTWFVVRLYSVGSTKMVHTHGEIFNARWSYWAFHFLFVILGHTVNPEGRGGWGGVGAIPLAFDTRSMAYDR